MASNPLIFWQKGMEYAISKFDAPINDTNKQKFKQFFGTSPRICAYLWDNISQSLPSRCHYFHLLWGLLFLTVYSKETVLCKIVGRVDEKTFRKWNWLVVQAISNLKPSVVS